MLMHQPVKINLSKSIEHLVFIDSLSMKTKGSIYMIFGINI